MIRLLLRRHINRVLQIRGRRRLRGEDLRQDLGSTVLLFPRKVRKLLLIERRQNNKISQQTRSKMPTAIMFSRQNNAGSREYCIQQFLQTKKSSSSFLKISKTQMGTEWITCRQHGCLFQLQSDVCLVTFICLISYQKIFLHAFQLQRKKAVINYITGQ